MGFSRSPFQVRGDCRPDCYLLVLRKIVLFVYRVAQFLHRQGSWLCENALAEAPTTRDLGEAAVFGHRAVLAAFFVWNGS
jgi:hypothetical protein